MDGLTLTPLRQIHHPKGDILHGIKASEKSYAGFGEAYFSTVAQGTIKGWKKHTKMVLNLIVPVGAIKFVFFNETTQTFESVTLSRQNYQRLTVNPNLWMAFHGLEEQNMLLNIANIEHNPDEQVVCELSEISYDWDNL